MFSQHNLLTTGCQPSLVSAEYRSSHAKMSREVEEERKEFLQWQLSQMRDTDIMSRIDPNISRILDQHYDLERDRVARLPVSTWIGN
jgi:hypothetical protein